MSIGPPNSVRLRMIRTDLENIPEFGLPDGFALRWHEDGDAAHWLRIHARADLHNVITPDLFVRQFGTDSNLLAQRQCFLLAPGGEVIGTATAWFNDNFEGRRIGRVHWVAILPEYQGSGLSKPLMMTVCKRLRELGHSEAYLVTVSQCNAAIQLYLHFGFVPLITEDTERVAWREILGKTPG